MRAVRSAIGPDVLYVQRSDVLDTFTYFAGHARTSGTRSVDHRADLPRVPRQGDEAMINGEGSWPVTRRRASLEGDQ